MIHNNRTDTDQSLSYGIKGNDDADIITGDGKQILLEAYYFRVNKRPASSYGWPKECPAHADIRLWQKVLRSISSDLLHLSFFDCLGQWIMAPHLTWPWYYDTTSRTLYLCHEQLWQEFQPISPCST